MLIHGAAGCAIALLVAAPALAIDSAPVLLDLQVVTPTVDSQAAPAFAVLSAQLSDADPGVCTSFCDDAGGASQVQLVNPATGQRRSAGWVFQSGDTYQAQVELDPESAGGLWQIETLWLADLAGNRRALSTADLALAGFDTDVQNDSATGDELPPELTAVAVGPLAFDASAGATVEVTVTASDGGSGVCALGCSSSSPGAGPSQVRYRHAGTGQVRDGLLVPLAPGSFLAEVDFPPGSADGAWTLEWLRLVDVAGNLEVLTGVDLDGLGFTSALAVSSSTADVEAPALLASAFAPDPIDTTAFAITASYDADASDDASGVCTSDCSDFGTASQVFFRRDGSDHARFGKLELVAGDALDGSFQAQVEVPRSGDADVWRPYGALLVDQSGNRVFVPEPESGAIARTALLALVWLRARRRARPQDGEGNTPTSAMM